MRGLLLLFDRIMASLEWSTAEGFREIVGGKGWEFPVSVGDTAECLFDGLFGQGESSLVTLIFFCFLPFPRFCYDWVVNCRK